MDEIKKLTEWFEGQVGVREIPVNKVIYNTHYYGGAVNGSAYPWCCAFIWDGFRECGLSRLFVGGEKTAYCPYVVNYARQHNQWVTSGYRQGDVVLYDWDGDGLADHIGFCVSVLGSALTVIEGNTDDAVRRMTRNEVGVMGAYRPAYDTSSDAGETPHPSAVPTPSPQGEGKDTSSTASGPPSPQGEGKEEKDLYVVQPGDSLWRIAERELGDGTRWDELRRYNNLPNTMIHPGQVLYLPGRTQEDDGKEDPAQEKVLLELPRDVYDKLINKAAERGISVDALLEDLL